MYPVSQDFLDALAAPSLRTRLTGTLTLNTGAKIALSDTSFLDGSVTVSNQCSEGSDIKLGGVYVGECDFTLLKPAFERRLLRAASVSLSAGLLAAGGWRDVPLGAWTVDSAKWSRSGVAVTAYDAMSLLDANCSATAVEATPFELLKKACDACHVTLADSEEYVQGLPNGAQRLSLADASGIETWRDWVSWIVQSLGAFATIDRAGRLHVGTYGTGGPVWSPGAYQRAMDSQYEDFESRCTGMSVVWASDSTTKYYAADPDDGLTCNLGQNPFMQTTAAQRDIMMHALVDAFSQVSSTPMNVNVPGVPFLDLGDLIESTGGYGMGASSNVMGFSYTPHQGVQLSAYGSDPALADARSKTDKDLAGIIDNVSASQLAQYAFTNGSDVSAGAAPTLLASVAYAAVKATMAVVHADIDLTASEATRATIAFSLDGVGLDRVSMDTLGAGPYLRHVMVALPVDDQAQHRLDILLASSNGLLDVKAGGVHGLCEGIGLGAIQWDGTLTLADSMPRWLLGRALAARAMSGSADATVQTPVPAGIAVSASRWPLGRAFALRGFDGHPGFLGFSLVDAYSLAESTVTGQVTAIGGMVMASGDSTVTTPLWGLDVNVRGVQAVASSSVTGAIGVLAAFGDGQWSIWDGSQWAASDTGMGIDMFTALPAGAWDGFDPAAGIRLRIVMPAGSGFSSIGLDWLTQQEAQ